MPLFSFRVDHYHHIGDVSLLPKLEEIDMKLSELVPEVQKTTAQLKKVEGEVRTLVQKIADLEVVIGQMDEVPADLQAAFDELKTQAGVVDEIVDDVPTPDPGE